MERFQANEWQCRILPAVLGGGCYRKCRILDLIKPLQTAHRAGLVAGDVHVRVLHCTRRIYRHMMSPLLDSHNNFCLFDSFPWYVHRCNAV